MFKKEWCECKVVVLLIKPIAFLPFSLPSALLKLLNSDFPYWLFLDTYLNKREGLKLDVRMNRSSLDVRLGRFLHELYVHKRCPSTRDKILPQNGFMFSSKAAYTDAILKRWAQLIVTGSKTAITSEPSGSTLVFAYKKIILAWVPI